MLSGINSLALDAKGRLAIPTRYRERLRESCASQLVITIDPDGCLLVYPLPEWQRVEQQLKSLPTFNRTVRQLQRLLVGHAHPMEMDRQGRVLVPPPLRVFAGLDTQAVLIGQMNKFELWDETRWNEQRQVCLEEIDLESLGATPGLENLNY
ncbi:MAG: division/cell wall cluster transcriptional repressor MraZ [Chromatiales bacterium]